MIPLRLSSFTLNLAHLEGEIFTDKPQAHCLVIFMLRDQAVSVLASFLQQRVRDVSLWQQARLLKALPAKPLM